MTRHSFSWFAVIALTGCGGDAVVAERKPLPEWYPPGPLVAACDDDAPALPKVPGALCEEDGWCWESKAPMGGPFKNLARVGDEIWVTAGDRVVLWDGRDWKYADADFPSGELLLGSEGGGALVANQTYGRVSLYDGAAWTTRRVAGGIFAVAGSPESDVWVLSQGLTQNGGFGAVVTRLEGDVWVNDAESTVEPGSHLAVRSRTDMWMDGPEVLTHFDGTEWKTTLLSQIVPGVAAAGIPPTVRALHVVGEKDVWLSAEQELAQIQNPDGQWVSETTSVLLRDDGGGFARAPGVREFSAVTAIQGTDPSDVWFGTARGEFLHWDGLKLTLESVAESAPSVSGIARAKDGTLFAHSSEVILEREGSSWNEHNPAGSARVATKVWGSAWNDVWAVGTGGLRLHFDGERWEPAEPGREDVTGIWGSRRDDVWTVSRNGYIDHYDGRKWTTVYEAGLPFSDVWGLGNGELWMSVNGPFLVERGEISAARYVRGELEMFEAGDASATAIWASSPTDVWLGVNASGGLDASNAPAFWRYDGETWAAVSGAPLSRVGDVWGRGPDDVYALGALSDFTPTLVHFDGTSWTSIDSGAPSTGGLWGCGDSDIFAGTRHLDGAEWRGPSAGVSGVWAASPNFAVAVGQGGMVLRKSR